MILLLACSYEGDDAGECTDGADNDRNGYFDCIDAGCRGSPDCEGDADTDSDSDSDTDSDSDSDTDTDTDTDTDSDSDTDTDADTDSDTDTDWDVDVRHLASYEVTMGVDYTFNSGGSDNCAMVYQGSGAQAEVVDGRVSFYGAYTRTESTCTSHGAIEPYFPWYDRSTEEAYNSFIFTDATTLDEWFADATETEFRVRAEWQMFEMAASFDEEALYADYSEIYTSGDGSFVVTYDVEVQFYE